MINFDLAVALEGRRIATLAPRDGQSEITYSAEYQQDPSATPLSVSMSRNDAQHQGTTLQAWLWGLLPDNNDVIRRWAKDYDASISSPASLLATEIGLDCAGAVQFYQSDQATPHDRDSGVQWLDEQAIEERLTDLATDATTWLGTTTTGQFSLAGAQSKTALRWDPDTKRWGVPRGNEPSTHIFKPAIPGLIDQHINEHLCLAAARNLSLRAAKTEILSFGSEQALVVERFDRTQEDGQWTRVHQEDLCQAIGIHPEQKYESDGGPTAALVAEAIRKATGPTVARREVRCFVDGLIFNWIIGGTDAHAKNYGLLHRGPQTRLAPLYDISSILPYDDSKGHKVKLAMKIGGEYKIKRTGRKQWIRLAQSLGLSEMWVLDRCEELATDTPEAFQEAAASCTKRHQDSTMPEQLHDLVKHAAQDRLNSLTKNDFSRHQSHQARYALVLNQPIPVDDLPHSDTLSIRMQLLVAPSGYNEYLYYQFVIARWPRPTLHADPSFGEPTFWPRASAAAIERTREWLTGGQVGRPQNVIDAVVLKMTELTTDMPTGQASHFDGNEPLFNESSNMFEWTGSDDLIKRPDQDLRPIGIQLGE